MRFRILMLKLALFIDGNAEPWYGEPFNGQRQRLQAVRRMIAAYEPDVFVETGTFLGHTTRFFLGQGAPVWTVEANRIYYLSARIRLGFAHDLTMARANSPDVVARLAREGFRRPFFYLDAHWWSHLPLEQELRAIADGWRDALIVIDDCAVPGDAGYKYDAYDGVSLAAENLDIPRAMVAGYPIEPSETETGARRGALYLAHGDRAIDVLDQVSTFRRSG